MAINKKTAVNKPKAVIINDLFLIAALLFACAIGAFYLFVLRGQGDTVKVTVDGKIYKTYSLSQNITEDIRIGEYNNRLVIRDGKAYIEEATCPDGICVDHSPIFRNGESIVCLPQRVVVTVITDNDQDSPDIIV